MPWSKNIKPAGGDADPAAADSQPSVTATPIKKGSSTKPRCGTCILRPHCLPAGLAPEPLRKFENMVQQFATLKPGEHLFRVGDNFQSLYAVRTGCLKTCAVDPNGREHVLNFHFVGEIIGIDAIFPEQHFADAIALVESSVCHLPYRAISQFAREVPELQVQLVRALSRHVFSMTSISGDFSADERLAAFLVMVGARNRLAGGSATEMQLAMSRQDIANYLRLATETVSRILARFQKSGLLRANRRQITLLNPDGLYAIAECMNPYSRCGINRRRADGGGRN
ncbi:MAG: helix-turn-helix domain-containing protein [Chromatiales bacterium]|nr:helix-turn-helix domain-containing protein [Chromatiales bacterium]